MGSVDQSLDPTNPHRFGSMADKTAVITGGSQGLGLATAELMKARGAAGLVLVGRDQAKGDAATAALDGDGCRVEFLSADVSTEAGVQSIIDMTEQTFGAVHSFVSCAAATWRGTIWNTDGPMWDKMLDTNVKANGLLITAMGQVMKREGIAGSMVVVGSVAHHGGIAELFPYIVSKHALEALVKHAAYALRAERIRVNLINPGWMDTPAEHEIQKRFHAATDDWLAQAEAEQPFGRLLKPPEVARGICFLASDESGMMTGANIDFDQTISGQGPLAPNEPVPVHYPWESPT